MWRKTAILPLVRGLEGHKIVQFKTFGNVDGAIFLPLHSQKKKKKNKINFVACRVSYAVSYFLLFFNSVSLSFPYHPYIFPPSFVQIQLLVFVSLLTTLYVLCPCNHSTQGLLRVRTKHACTSCSSQCLFWTLAVLMKRRSASFPSWVQVRSRICWVCASCLRITQSSHCC